MLGRKLGKDISDKAVPRTFQTTFDTSLAQLRVLKNGNILAGREDGRKVAKGKRNRGMQT